MVANLDVDDERARCVTIIDDNEWCAMMMGLKR